MCNYTRDKPNTQQRKAFPDPRLPDKEQDAFFDQLTDFKIAIPALMNFLTGA